MAVVQGTAPGVAAVRLGFSPSSSSPPVRVSNGWNSGHARSNRRLFCKSMVQQAVPGTPSVYAKEMERLSAKESLLLAFKDAGGFEALVTGKTTDMHKIDVNERITGLERLNPTPRPTTSPCLEGRWNFEWFGSGSPGLYAAKVIFERFPSQLANLSNLDIVIKDGYAKATANVKFLNMMETKFILSSKLSIEGPLRMKEEYIEGSLESPTMIEEAVPDEVRGALSQAVTTLEQLPPSIKDTLSSGLRIPLGGSFQRFFMISYLDEEILIIRDTAGIPEVLTRSETPSSPVVETVEYVS